MQLINLSLVTEVSPVNITIVGERIFSISSYQAEPETNKVEIYFKNALAIPGLINSHDHLDFNCFQKLGNKKYKNYTDWGIDIHKHHKEEINQILKIPISLRAAWGMYKNLLSGVTTVVNHGATLKIDPPLINIYQDSQNLHSVHFDKNWKWKLNNPAFIKKNCVIHIGEGADRKSVAEINTLLKFNLLKRKLIGVHGVALKPSQAINFKGLIWCPESNKALLGEHANINQLKFHVPVVFGTDSTLSADWNIWKHIRLARTLQKVTDQELFAMLTSSPAVLWKLNSGTLLEKKDADIVVIKAKYKNSGWENIYNSNPEDILLVVHRGKIRMFDKTLLPQLNRHNFIRKEFSQIRINSQVKFVEGDLPGLLKEIKCHFAGMKFPIESFEDIYHYEHA